MKIFEFTRVKLTVWYVLIIMAISSMFSFVIFNAVTSNLQSSFRRTETRLRADGMPHHLMVNLSTDNNDRELLHQLFSDELESSRRQVFYYLLILNGIILTFSTFASYFLAGQTLAPIEKIVSEQKRFITDASHELKTPLTSLKTSIEVALRDKKLPLKAKNVLHSNLEDVDALNDLISQLLFLASQENSKLVFKKVNLQTVIRKSIKVVRPIASDKDIKLSLSLQPVAIWADSFSIKELFVILLDNAVKYSHAGDVIEVVMTTTNNLVKIQIIDRGIGIHKKYLPHIFDRFYRVDDARCVRNCGGYGLGLSLAKKIVENHHGKISVSTQLTQGSTFTVKFPIKK